MTRIFPALLAFLAFMLIAACETVPAPVVNNDAPFASAMASAKGQADPYASAAAYTAILEREDLTEDQTVRALFARGSLRRQAGDNRRGAVADFEKLLALAPAHPLAQNASVELGYTRRDITVIENSMRPLLTLAAWFDKAWVLGDRDKAATRYQRSRLSPQSAQVTKLIRAGYICRSGGEGGSVYQLGDRRSDLNGLNWCRPLGATS